MTAGMILAIIGLLALLFGAAELVIAKAERRRQARAIAHHRLRGYPPPADYPCPWPTLEPEVERLRERGAL